MLLIRNVKDTMTNSCKRTSANLPHKKMWILLPRASATAVRWEFLIDMSKSCIAKMTAKKSETHMLFWVILAWICFLYSCFSLQSPPKLSLVKVDHLRKLFWCPGNFAPRIICWATEQKKEPLCSKPSLWVSMLVFRECPPSKLSCFGGSSH